MSPDGRYVAFESVATDLVPGGTANRQIFRKDLWTGAVVLCSSSAAGTQGNGNSSTSSLSEEGRYVAFESDSTNLVPGGTAGIQAFRKDLWTGDVALCSSSAAGTQGNNNSFGASMSCDGRYVAFDSLATNLVPGGTTNQQVFCKDLQTGGITLCSSNAAGIQGNAGSYAPSINRDGRYVAIASLATDLIPGVTANQQIFRKDLMTGGIILCSADAAGIQGNNHSFQPSISPDGSCVAFSSDATDLLPAPTANRQVFRKDLMTGGIILCSADAAGIQGNNHSFNPSLSVEGRCVAFESLATDLVPGGTANRQIFRKDITNGTIELCSSSAAGIQGNNSSYSPSINPNGRYVAFDTDATDLVPGGTANAQVFRKELDLPLPITWYLAEGYTGGEFDTWVLVQNPGAVPAQVTLTFQVQGGAAPPFGPFTLPAGERSSIHLDDLPDLSDAQVSTQVTSDVPVVAERAMYFTYDGKPGGHDSIGVTSPAATWYLAEGYTGGEFDTWVLIQNPGTVPAQVTLDFQVQGGAAPPFGPFALPAGQRQSIHLDDLPDLSDAQVSTRVISNQPVVAERAMYFTYDGKSGGHDSVGVNMPAFNWYMAEGYTGGEFDTWVLVQNPGTVPATVTLDFQVQGGLAPPFGPFNLAAGERQSVHLDDLPSLSDAQVSTRVTSDQPVVAERAMYFTYEGRSGGHDSKAANYPADTWYMAEGYTGGEFDTWVLIQNPGTTPAQVTLTFQVQGGAAPPFGPFTLPAGQRQSIHLDDLPDLSDAQVSTQVTSNVPVVAERAMYFTYEGRSGGHDSVGYTP